MLAAAMLNEIRNDVPNFLFIINIGNAASENIGKDNCWAKTGRMDR